MATHNVADGTGGLDASICFLEETSRPEVRVVTDRYVSSMFIPYTSCSGNDNLVIENCGGPEIAFRGGRIDAGEPNTPGVPEPQQDLDSHVAAFTRQGFTQTEMIKLIACGHSFGGVEHAPFPDIVPEMNDANNTLSVAHFDSTFVHFDNNVATEYISGTTPNPLVVGLNDTTNSDKRIFSSDGNVTMKSFADSPELFASTCADMFARMLDTVPCGVELTEVQVITPLPVKPHNLILRLAGDTLKLAGEIRFWNMTAGAQRTVFMLLDGHAGGTGNATLTSSGVSTAVSGRYGAAWKREQIRNGLNPSRVFLVQVGTVDRIDRQIVVETDIPRPMQPVSAIANYSIWSIELTNENSYFIGAEVDGVKFSGNDDHGAAALGPCTA
ncbi:heme peroxidase [Mycena albidolilacea]|uniref:Peroxidase n=1 Tax=Mycena albidolilacea TaxID=1033008 RepID=A0AAD7EGD8_9AGAR|nr:heme peroxidase [Mycena albidolilacea]